MSTTKKVFGGLAGCLSGTVIGSTVIGGIGAAQGALSGLVGAKVLESAGYAGYVASEAVESTALGSAIVNGSIGGFVGSCTGVAIALGIYLTNKNRSLFFNIGCNKDKKDKNNCSLEKVIGVAAICAGVQTLSAMIGREILINNGRDITMSAAKMAASAAVGSAITSIPTSIVLNCCALAIVAGIFCCVTANEESMVRIPKHR